MDHQQPYQAPHRQIGFALLDPPILHARYIMVKSKILVAGVALLLSKLR